jgi:hypothetical protein
MFHSDDSFNLLVSCGEFIARFAARACCGVILVRAALFCEWGGGVERGAGAADEFGEAVG